MEVMSSLLLVALVALPQALGWHIVQSSGNDIQANNTVLTSKPNYNTKLFFTGNGRHVASKVNTKDYVHHNTACNKCNYCTLQFLQANKHLHVPKSQLESFEDFNDILEKSLHREKRKSEYETTLKGKSAKVNKTRSKKTRVQNLVTVTKFNLNRKITAVKVKETNADDQKSGSTCEIFSVVNSYPCGTPEATKLLESTKKSSKKYKKEESLEVQTMKYKLTTPDWENDPSGSKKKQGESTSNNENIALSFEEYF